MGDRATSELLRDRVAIVTGAGWNIGRAVARRLAAEGARVVVAARRETLLRETAAQIRAAGGEALVVPTDVTVPEQVEAMVAKAVDHFGTVDALAAIAGGGLDPRPLEQVSLAAWEHVFRANVTSTFLCVRAVLPILRRKDRGSVLTCTGGGSFFPMLGVEYNAYACAKAAICRFTDQMTAELWETGIRFNCLEPGKVLTAERLAEIEGHERRTGRPHPDREGNHPPEDAAELAAWLLSDASKPLRGRCVSVNDTWWRDPAKVAAVEATVFAYRLRRMEL
jgi:NAD(P)-dependent dehydrogenase (short-subunit alcohol dehydrogenase family)